MQEQEVKRLSDAELKDLRAWQFEQFSESPDYINRARMRRALDELEQLRGERLAWTESARSELWSLFRSVLSQGSTIEQDYRAGRYETYEHFARRLDIAAIERANEFEKGWSPTSPIPTPAEPEGK